MNLSQILNPPSNNSTSNSAISTRQGRANSPQTPLDSSSTTNTRRFSNGSNTGGGSNTRKRSSSVTAAQLEEQFYLKYGEGAGYPQGHSYLRIRSNEIHSSYSTLTFRANPPAAYKENPVTTPSSSSSSPSNPSNTVSTPITGKTNQLVMSHSTPNDILSTISTKKKPRNNAAEDFIFQDPIQSKLQTSFESYEVPPSTAPKKKAAKKTSQSPTLENESQQPREIRFVISDKEGQRTYKHSPSLAPRDISPVRDSPGDDNTSQESSQSSPTPDFERNADGKFRCSWPRCGKEFTVASRLTTHYRIHSGKPPYLCGYKDCQKAFHTSSSLSHHRVVHTDQNLRPYVCRHNRCGATYTQLARLITHQRTTHSGMILFIPQDSSSSPSLPPTSTAAPTNSSLNTLPSQPQSLSQSQGQEVVTPHSNNNQSNFFNHSQSTPSEHAAGGSNIVNPRSVSPSSTEPSRQLKQNLDDSGHPTSNNIIQQTSDQTTFPRSTVDQPTNHSSNAYDYDNGNDNINQANNNIDNNNRNDQSSRSSVSSDSNQNYDPKETEGGNIDELRQREEAALTMTSFREMAMLRQQQPHASSSTSPTPYSPPYQQSSPNSNSQHYSNQNPEYYYQQQQQQQQPSQGYREYQNDPYQQYPTKQASHATKSRRALEKGS